MSLQVAIMKVLASYPDGRATVAAMKSDLAILAGAGLDWSLRLKRIADRAPGLDIFTEGLVVRDNAGWRLTIAGRQALRRLEMPAQAHAPVQLSVVPAAHAMLDQPCTPSVAKLIGVRGRQRRRGRPVAMDRLA